MDSCAYVTQGWGVHDERWVAALRDCGFTVETFSRDRDGLSVEEIRGALDDTRGPVLAGPVNSMTEALVGGSRPVIGLSWGFDLLEMHDSGSDLSWMSRLNGLIVDSHANRDIARGSGIATNRVFEIPWGIDIGAFTPQGDALTPDNFDLPSTARLILSLRALDPLYRVADIIDAFALIAADHTDAHLLIGNNGHLRDELEARAVDSGVRHRIRFIGKFAESELPPLLRAAAIYVTASEVDGTSVTLLQAMACEIPVVASDTPGNRQWVAPGRAGALFTTHSTAALADRLGEMLDSPPEPIQRAAARAVVAEHADWTKNSAALGSIMRGST